MALNETSATKKPQIKITPAVPPKIPVKTTTVSPKVRSTRVLLTPKPTQPTTLLTSRRPTRAPTTIRTSTTSSPAVTDVTRNETVVISTNAPAPSNLLAVKVVVPLLLLILATGAILLILWYKRRKPDKLTIIQRPGNAAKSGKPKSSNDISAEKSDSVLEQNSQFYENVDRQGEDKYKNKPGSFSCDTETVKGHRPAEVQPSTSSDYVNVGNHEHYPEKKLNAGGHYEQLERQESNGTGQKYTELNPSNTSHYVNMEGPSSHYVNDAVYEGYDPAEDTVKN